MINMIHINGTVVVSKACGAGVGYASHGEEGGGSAFILGEIFSPGQIRLTPFGLRLALVGAGHGHCRSCSGHTCALSLLALTSL
jgi:hypothetical protein